MNIDHIKQFINDWSALGLENPTKAVELEHEVVVNEHKCFIDVLIPSTKVLIENKSRGSEKSDALVDEAFKCYEKETTVPQYVALGKK